MTTTAQHPAIAPTPRTPTEPSPDLLDYRLVHRAMAVDLDRLADAAAEMASHPDEARLRALRRYLDAVSTEIDSHHRIEDEHVWPHLAALVGDDAVFDQMVADHDSLATQLSALHDLARTGAVAHLAAGLRHLADDLARHIADEEGDLFPMIEAVVTVQDYKRLQRAFRSNLRLRLLPFVVPWVVSHATGAERAAVLADAGLPMRVVHRLFASSFRRREAALFRRPSPSSGDRRTVRRGCRFARMHTASSDAPVAASAVDRSAGARGRPSPTPAVDPERTVERS